MERSSAMKSPDSQTGPGLSRFEMKLADEVGNYCDKRSLVTFEAADRSGQYRRRNQSP
jgi:hypothetical protein